MTIKLASNIEIPEWFRIYWEGSAAQGNEKNLMEGAHLGLPW